MPRAYYLPKHRISNQSKGLYMKKMAKRSALASLVTLSLTSYQVIAQQATPAPTTPQATTPVVAEKPADPPPPAIFSIGGFDLTGHVDIGYTNLRGAGKFASGLNSRVFDFDRNKANLQSIDLQLASTPENGFGGLLDVTLGKDADTIAAYGTIDKNRGPANGVDKRADVTQAFVHYGAGALTLIAGKFVTLSGAEVIKSAADTNYSRSILFGYAIPFTHTGVRATYKVSDTLSLIGGVNQGWDAFKDTNNDKTIELSAAFTPDKAVSLLVTGYSGKELVANYPKSKEKGTRNLLDLVLTLTVSEQLTLIANYDYGSQDSGSAAIGKAKWQGFAGYANYQFSEQWRASLRGEYFDDKDGYRTGVLQKWKEATATVAYLPNKNLELRAEVRGDRSDKDAFLKSDGKTLSKTERSFGVELLYKF